MQRRTTRWWVAAAPAVTLALGMGLSIRPKVAVAARADSGNCNGVYQCLRVKAVTCPIQAECSCLANVCKPKKEPRTFYQTDGGGVYQCVAAASNLTCAVHKTCDYVNDPPGCSSASDCYATGAIEGFTYASGYIITYPPNCVPQHAAAA